MVRRTGRQTAAMVGTGRSGAGRAAFLAFYAVPLLATAVALWAVGLPELAAALLVVELCVLAMIAAVRRPPRRSTRRPARPWVVPAVMVGALALMVGLAVLASSAD